MPNLSFEVSGSLGPAQIRCMKCRSKRWAIAEVGRNASGAARFHRDDRNRDENRCFVVLPAAIRRIRHGTFG
jgi:hypothetical protein